MKFKPSNKITTEFSMSSLTDIVFLLLIFFMLTSSSVKGLNINLPGGKGDTKNTKNNITISIDKDGIYYVNKKMVLPQNLDIEIMTESKTMNNPTIIIMTDSNISVQKVITVMDIANQYEYKVVLAVKEK